MDYRDFQQLPKWNFGSAKIPQRVNTAAPANGTSIFSKRKTINLLAAGLNSLFPSSKRELVAGGDVKWKPVDKQAAMLLAKSPDINKQMSTSNTSSTRMGRPSFIKGDGGQNYEGVKVPRSDADVDNKITHHLQTAADKLPEQLQERVDILKSVRASLDLATDMFRQDMIEFTKELPANIEKMRSWRMTMDREKELALHSLKEIRTFFLGADHDKEMQRLSEFVRTCERLETLAANGTLEKVADVMLKLA